MMSPGQAAYEHNKQQKKDQKMQAEKTAEDRARREEKADAVVELVLDALKAFVAGDAAIVISRNQETGEKQIRLSVMPAKEQ